MKARENMIDIKEPHEQEQGGVKQQWI